MAKIENLEYLTKKQLVVLFLWCHEGMTNEEIAKHLKRDAKTIQTHFSKIYTILEIETKGKTTDEIRYELGIQICPVIKTKYKSVEDILKTHYRKPPKKTTSLRQEIINTSLQETALGKSESTHATGNVEDLFVHKSEKEKVTAEDREPPKSLKTILEKVEPEPRSYQDKISQPIEPYYPPPRPRRTIPDIRTISRQRSEQIHIPWSLILAIVLLGIVFIGGWRLLRQLSSAKPNPTQPYVQSTSSIYSPNTAKVSSTPRKTNTPRQPTRTPTSTFTPTITPTPVSLPFEDNFSDQIRPEWVILGDIPYVKDGMLVTGKMIDDANFRGLSGMYVGDNSWRNLTIEAKIEYDCINAFRKVGIGVRVGGLGKPMIFAPFTMCHGNLYSSVLTDDLTLIYGESPHEALSPEYDFHHWRTYTNFVGVETTEIVYDFIYYVTIKLTGNHMSMYFDSGTGIDVDLPSGYESGGVFIILDESVAYDYIKISPIP